MAVAIPLNHGMTAYVDEADYHLVAGRTWTYRKPRRGRNTGYAITSETIATGRRRQIAMHQLILPAPKGMYTDHIDRDGLNNRRLNLRIATPSQNGVNIRKRVSRTGLLGVSLQTRGRQFSAQICFKQRDIFLGTFPSTEEAARVRDAAAFLIHGEFAVLNFPDSIEHSLNSISECLKTRLASLAGDAAVVITEQLEPLAPLESGAVSDREEISRGLNHAAEHGEPNGQEGVEV